MPGTRSVLIAFVTALGLGVAGCSTMDVEDYCRYAEHRSIRDADPESLALVLGMRPGSVHHAFRDRRTAIDSHESR
jgi:hypothetical protein